jgi:chromosomal replication initiation ATPase DnaA
LFDRDHAGVIVASRKIKAKREADPVFDMRITILEMMLRGAQWN